MENKIIVYAKLNEKNEILELQSSIFLNDITGWTKIDEGQVGDKYAHPQGNYFGKDESPIRDEQGRPNYKYVDGELLIISDEEKLDSIIENGMIPTIEDRLLSVETLLLDLI